MEATHPTQGSRGIEEYDSNYENSPTHPPPRNHSERGWSQEEHKRFRDPERANPSLKQKIERQMAPHEKLQTSYEDLQASYKEKQTSYRKLRISYEELRISYEELRISYEELQNYDKKLRSFYEKRQTSYEEQQAFYEGQRASYEEQIENLQCVIDREEIFQVSQRMDSEIAQRIENIRGRVQTFANEAAHKFKKSLAAGNLGDLPNFSPEVEKEIKRVVPIHGISVPEILASIVGVRSLRFFLQGWIHLSLWGFIFRSSLQNEDLEVPLGGNPIDHWLSDRIGESIKILEEEYASLVRRGKMPSAAFHKWRALTLSILYSTSPINYGNREHPVCPEIIEQRCQEMAETIQKLGSFIENKPDNPSVRAENIDCFKAALKNIFGESLELSALLRTQKAAFGMCFPAVKTLEMPQPKVPARPDLSPWAKDPWVEVQYSSDDMDSQFVVYFVLEPAWFKSGDAYGEKYNTGCFTNAKVACLPAPSRKPEDQFNRSVTV